MIPRNISTCARKALKAVPRVLGGLLFLGLAGCSADAPLNYLKPVGPAAKSADDLWRLTFGIAVVIFFLVEGGLVFVLVKYRQRSPKDSPKQVHGNARLEILWTLIPTLILGAVVAPPTVKGIFEMSAAPTADTLKIKVIGHQWWWEYRYPEGVVTANELHIPTGRPVRLELTSVDVIHSFWVPKLAGKQDVVPGRVNYLNIESPRAGEFAGQCAEFCGLSHANMRVTAIAQSPADYDAWVKGQLSDAPKPSGGLAAAGQDLFLEGSCAGCHTIKGTPAQGTLAPNLTHLASRATFAAGMFPRDDENLKRWLENPPARKPGSKMPNLRLKQDDILALVAYLDTLK
ncbi:MAG: cytochrome c oxidase subunit II [Actinomycetota bacterium]